MTPTRRASVAPSCAASGGTGRGRVLVEALERGSTARPELGAGVRFRHAREAGYIELGRMSTTSAPPPASARLRRAAVVPARGSLFARSPSGVVALAYVLRGVLVPLFFAFLLAYALDPFVDWLEARKVPRALGALPS